MKIKVQFGYGADVIFPLECLPLIEKALFVKGEGYGKEARYIPSGDTPTIEMIQDNQIVLSEVETIEIFKKKAEALEKEKSAEWLKAYNAQKKVDELTKELSILKGVCPHIEPTNPVSTTPNTDEGVPF